MDVLTEEQRHKNMSRILGKDTKPEEIVRKFLFQKDFDTVKMTADTLESRTLSFQSIEPSCS